MTSHKLGDLIEIKHGYAFSGQNFCADGPFVLLTPGNFYDAGGFKFRADQKHYDGPAPSDFILNEGDLLVAMTEQGEGLLGSAAFVPSGKKCLHNQRLGLVSPKASAEVDLRYVYYLLNSRNVRQQIRATASGAKVRHTSPSRIYAVTVPEHSIEAQRRIASILGAYDDLIEVNRRRIAVLEEMARGLFESFVTKVIGELPPASGGSGNAALPDGWHISDLRNVTEIIMGQSPPSEELNKDGDGFPFHQGVTDFGPLFPRRRIFCVPSSKKKVAATGDILFSVRAPVGRINLATEEVVLGRGVSSFRSTIGAQHYLAAHLRATFYEPDLIGNGAIYKAVGRSDIQRIPIVLPPAEIRAELDVKIASIYDFLWTLEQSNKALAASRDLLLPRLISGQLSVAEAERQLEEAA